MPAHTTRPNILLIMTDQQRGDCLGSEGHPSLLTPNMDSIAAAGMRFRHAYSTSPVCIPARRSLMSGLSPQRHGVVGYAERQEWELDASLPALLRDAGYHTGLVGRSMHLHPPRKRFGFEEMVTNPDYEEFLDARLPEGGGHRGSGVMHNDWTARSYHMPEHLHQTHWTVNEALRFLRRRDPVRPWFLTVSFTAPHPPLVPPDFYFQRYLRAEPPAPVIGDWCEKPSWNGVAPKVDSAHVNLTGEALRSCRAGYYGLINHVDDEIRRLLSPVTGFDAKNTMVVFTSDHGEMLGDHYLFRKSLPYEPAARIPFLMHLPRSMGEAVRGGVSELPVCLEDILPTVLDVAGLPAPKGIDGRSLLPVLMGEKPSRWRASLHIEIGGGKNAFHALTNGREKYIWFSQTGVERFFDLEKDPRECHDLINSAAAQKRVTKARAELTRRLRDRPEKFVRNGKLVSGRPHGKVIPQSRV